MTKEESKEATEEELKNRFPKHGAPVSYLLAHGDPETAHIKKTWVELFTFPVVLALIFFLSLLTFHYAPHQTRRPRKKFTLPTNKKLEDSPKFDL